MRQITVNLPNEFIIGKSNQRITNDLDTVQIETASDVIESAIMCFLQNRTYSEAGKKKNLLSQFSPSRNSGKPVSLDAVKAAVESNQIDINQLVNVLVYNAKTHNLDLQTVIKQAMTEPATEPPAAKQ